MKLDLERAKKVLSAIKCDDPDCRGTRWELRSENGLALIQCQNSQCNFHLITVIPKLLEPEDRLSFLFEDNGVRVCLNGTKTKAKFLPESQKYFVTKEGISASAFAEKWGLDLAQLVNCLQQCCNLKANVDYPQEN